MADGSRYQPEIRRIDIAADGSRIAQHKSQFMRMLRHTLVTGDRCFAD
jgi:hypothetical protein